MAGTVPLLGTLDTKGHEYAFVRDRLRELGVAMLLVDAGINDPVGLEPDVARHEVAQAGGANIEELASAGDRGAAVEAMARGAPVLVRRLFDEGRFDGILALGGSGGSSIASAAMRALPVGRPKLMVSTMAAGDTRP
ncbi:MAG: Tm-1-like ATP-binding domain-containing protein, partial [Myxococcales bacterium]|nr:Tm-1-like ATP-binding domain-containing protein [Myxococcales bacterium]